MHAKLPGVSVWAYRFVLVFHVHRFRPFTLFANTDSWPVKDLDHGAVQACPCSFLKTWRAPVGKPLRNSRRNCVHSRCGAVRIFGLGDHFSWQAQGKPRVLVLKSTFRDRRRRSTNFVAGAVLWTWWWSSACSDFVAGAMNRFFLWTCVTMCLVFRFGGRYNTLWTLKCVFCGRRSASWP